MVNSFELQPRYKTAIKLIHQADNANIARRSHEVRLAQMGTAGKLRVRLRTRTKLNKGCLSRIGRI